MLENLKFLLIGSIAAISIKLLYLALLLIFFIAIINWTYRRILCVFDAGWTSYSIRNLFRLVFCLIFLLLSGFSLSGIFIPIYKFQARPYIVFVISINTLYTVTMLGSSLFKEFKKSRIIINSFLFSSWCIIMVILYIFSIQSSSKVTSLATELTFWEFGLSAYKKLNPFFIGKSNLNYTIFSIIFINTYNLICILPLAIFSKKILSLRKKLVSFKWILLIDFFIFLKDILYSSYTLTSLSKNNFYAKIIGSSLSIILIIITSCFILFIHNEGKYDKNLKKKQIKDLKKDLLEILTDFEKIDKPDSTSYLKCKKRIISLLKRIKILNIKVDISKLITIKNPEVKKDFTHLIEDALFTKY